MNIYYNGRNSRVEYLKIYHPVHLMAHVRFPDGYENIFFTDVESGKWTEQDLGFTELARLFGEQYKFKSTGEKSIYKKLVWHFCIHDGKPFHFAYCQYKIFDFSTFEIYSPNRRYLFAMVCVSSTEWKVIKIPGETMYDNDLIICLTRILEPHAG